MYDFYDRGINIWLGALFGYKVLINSKEEWYIKKILSKKNPPKGFKEWDLRMLGQLPYENIVHYKMFDEYYSEPHLYCKYIGIKNSPYAKAIYLTDFGSKNFRTELDPRKEIDEV